MNTKYQPGDPVRLIRNPEARGHIVHAYERGIFHVLFNDGSSELCEPEELEAD